MRIIAGEKRGMKLVSPVGEDTRPTTDKVREALFGSLQFELRGKCVLDLFAGSGAFGLEAVSRGAGCAVLVDSDEDAIKVITKNVEKTGFSTDRVRVLRSDYKKAIKGFQKANKFDIVFLDPPYASAYYDPAMRMLVEYGLLNQGALVVTESDGATDVSAAGLEKYKDKQYGNTKLTYYRFEGNV